MDLFLGGWLARGRFWLLSLRGLLKRAAESFWVGVSVLIWLVPGEADAATNGGRLHIWGEPEFPAYEVPSDLGRIVSFSLSQSHLLTVDADGSVVGFGRDRDPIVAVPENLTPVEMIASSSQMAIVLTKAGRVEYWDQRGVYRGWSFPEVLGAPIEMVVAFDVAYALFPNGRVGFLQVGGTTQSGFVDEFAPEFVSVQRIHANRDRRVIGILSDGTAKTWCPGCGEGGLPGIEEPVREVSVSTSHTLVLLESGQVTGVGENTYGQLNIPEDLGPVIGVRAGTGFSVALRADGTVRVWGGGGDNGWRRAPTGLSSVLAIAAADSIGALVDSRVPVILGLEPRVVASVGHQIRLQVEVLSETPYSIQWFRGPDAIEGANSESLDLGMVSAGDAGDFSVSVTNASGLEARQNAQLVVLEPERPTDRSEPGYLVGWDCRGDFQASAGLGLVTDVAVGAEQSIALRADGTVIQFGNRLSEGASEVDGLTDVVDIDAGTTHSIAVNASGSVSVWDRRGFHPVPEGMGHVDQVAAGFSYSVALDQEGSLTAWNLLGNQEPIRLNESEIGKVVQIEAGRPYFSALRSDGTVFRVHYPSGTVEAVEHLQGVAEIAKGKSANWGYLLAYRQAGEGAVAGITRFDAVVARQGSAILPELYLALPYKSPFSQCLQLPLYLEAQPLLKVRWSRERSLAIVPTAVPVLVDPPADRSVNPGHRVEFSAAYVADDDFGFRWEKDGVPVPNVVGRRLVIERVRASDAGEYTVVVTQENGVQDSVTASLEVIPRTLPAEPSGYLVSWGIDANEGLMIPSDLKGVLSIESLSNRTVALLDDGTLEGWNGLRAGLVNPEVFGAVHASADDFALLAGGDVVTIFGRGVPTARVTLPRDTVPESLFRYFNSLYVIPSDGAAVVWDLSGGRDPQPLPISEQWEGILDLITVIRDFRSAPYGLTGTGQVLEIDFSPEYAESLVELDERFVDIDTTDGNRIIGLTVSGELRSWQAGSGEAMSLPESLPSGITQFGLGSHRVSSRSVTTLAVVSGGRVTCFLANRDGTWRSLAVPIGLENVVDVVGSDGSFTARVVSDLPSLLSELRSTSVTRDQTALFSVDAAGLGPLEYQWSFEGQPIAGAVEATYVIPPGDGRQSGTYSVVVTDRDGSSVGAEAELIILESAGIPERPAGQAVEVALDGSIRRHPPRGYHPAVSFAETRDHVLALLGDGTVIPIKGQLEGDWALPDGLGTVAKLVAGRDYFVALNTDGRLLAWGDYPPVESDIPNHLGPFLDVATGAGFAVALRTNGTVVVWGDLGFGGRRTPPPDLSDVIAVAAGSNFGVALTQGGFVEMWGEIPSALSRMPANLHGVVSVAASGSNVIALRADGEAVAWGNVAGLGANRLEGIVRVFAGRYRVLALDASGQVFAWDQMGVAPVDAIRLDGVDWIGDGQDGQFYAIANPLKPVVLPSSRTLIINEEKAADLTVDAIGDGRLGYQWFHAGEEITGASNDSLSLENASMTDAGDYLVQVTDQSGNIEEVAFQVHVLPRRASELNAGMVVEWGRDNGKVSVHSEYSDVIDIVAGDAHTLGLRADGSLVVWARPWARHRASRPEPGLPIEAHDIVAIDLRDDAAAALRADGSLLAWDVYQDFSRSSARESFTGLEEVIGIAGSEFALTSTGLRENSFRGLMVRDVDFAIAVNGRLSLAGDLDGGWLHDRIGGNRLSREGLAGLVDIVPLGVGQIELFEDGGLASIGHRGAEELQPPELPDVVAISAKGEHALVLLASGHVQGWGRNGLGAVEVPRLMNQVRGIAAGPDHGAAIVDARKPVILEMDYVPRLHAGFKMVVQVTVAGEGILTYQWEKDGMPIDGAISSRLEIAQTRVSDSGDYTLRVSDGDGDSSSRTIRIEVLPERNTGRDFGQLALSQGQGEDPVSILSQYGNTVDVASWSFISVLRTDGSIRLSGEATSGIITGLGEDLVQVELSALDVFALQADGTIRAFNDHGKFQPTWPELGSSIDFPPNLHGVVAMETNPAGGSFGDPVLMLLRADGAVGLFGDSLTHLAEGRFVDGDFVAISLGEHIALGLRKNGNVAVWGSSTSFEIPAADVAGGTAIAAGDEVGAVVGADGLIRWFSTADRELEIRTIADSENAVKVWLPSHSDGGPLFATTDSGRLFAWYPSRLGSSLGGVLPRREIKIPGRVVSAAIEGLRNYLVVVPDSPQVVQPIGPSVLLEGHVIQLLSGGQGRNLHFQWYKDGILIEGGTLAELDLGPATIESGGEYSVEIWNEDGSTENRVQLRVVSALPELGQVGDARVWGQLGSGRRPPIVVVPAPPEIRDVRELAVGENHTLALHRDGSLTGWGGNRDGESTIAEGLPPVVEAVVGSGFSAALTESGEVHVWGREGLTMEAEPLEGIRASQIVAGAFHLLVLTTGGEVIAVGANGRQQLEVPDGLSGVAKVRASTNGSAAIKADGTLVVWGAAPRPPQGLDRVRDVAITSGFGVALREDGSVVSWGRFHPSNRNEPPRPEALRVPEPQSGVVAIAVGSEHYLALKDDGTVFSYPETSGWAVVPHGLSGVVSIAAGDRHSVALRADGTVVVWGLSEASMGVDVHELSGVSAVYAHATRTGIIQQAASSLPTGVFLRVEPRLETDLPNTFRISLWDDAGNQVTGATLAGVQIQRRESLVEGESWEPVATRIEESGGTLRIAIEDSGQLYYRAILPVE